MAHGKPTGELLLRLLYKTHNGAKKTARSTDGYPGFKGQTTWLTEAAAKAGGCGA